MKQWNSALGKRQLDHDLKEYFQGGASIVPEQCMDTNASPSLGMLQNTLSQVVEQWRRSQSGLRSQARTRTRIGCAPPHGSAVNM